MASTTTAPPENSNILAPGIEYSTVETSESAITTTEVYYSAERMTERPKVYVPFSAQVIPLNMANRAFTASESQAIRLYNSVVLAGESAGSDHQLMGALISESKKSLTSNASSEDKGTCRICRWNRSDMEVLNCPCLCKGSVGFVHLQCLKRWMLLRRNSNCEICNGRFNVPPENFNLRRMCSSFFSMRCSGYICRNLLFCTSLVPLSHVILHQVLMCMEKLNVGQEDMISVKEVLLGTFALLTSSALFFHIFEFIATRLMHCRHLLRQWWLFGNSSEFTEMELIEAISDFL